MLLSLSSLILVKSRFVINAGRKSSLMTPGTCQSALRSVWAIRDLWVIKRLLHERPLPTLGKGSWPDGLRHVDRSQPGAAVRSPFHLCLLISCCFSDYFFPFAAQKPQKLRHHKMRYDIIDAVTFGACQDFEFFLCLAICQHVLIEPTYPYGICSLEENVWIVL